MRRWWVANGSMAIFCAMVFTPLALLSTCAVFEAIERDNDQIALRCQELAGVADACPMTSEQRHKAEVERRRAEEAARWDREARKILEAGR